MASSAKHILAGKKIVISGAGIAGLIFARALEQRWPTTHPKPEIVIYERSPEVQSKSRAGYSIGIRVESGLKALHQVGLLQTALASSTCEVDNDLTRSPTIWNRHWQMLMQAAYVTTPSKDLPENTPPYIRLSRGKLRSILLEDSTATIHYENMIESARILPDGKTELRLSDGATITCDLLIAADGASSRLRRSLLPNEKLTFAGVVGYIGQFEFPHGKPEPVQQRWGINISGQGVPLMIFPVDSTHGVWATSYKSKGPVKALSSEEAAQQFDEVLSEVNQLTHMFDDPRSQILAATERDSLTVFNAMHKYPIEHARTLPHANVMFLGDANHPMSPFSGNGANMALMDGVVAAEKLLQHSTSLRDAIAAFDAESMPRCKSAIDKSYWTIEILHARGLAYWVFLAFFAVVNFVKTLKIR